MARDIGTLIPAISNLDVMFPGDSGTDASALDPSKLREMLANESPDLVKDADLNDWSKSLAPIGQVARATCAQELFLDIKEPTNPKRIPSPLHNSSETQGSSSYRFGIWPGIRSGFG
ncbi:MAG: hypothetical protein PHR15_01190 [Atopobiaceae bacterium]|nr:hypothetical protein [Atopobiaceae bacterium]MCH4214784.1 hypothetical protein [Atopobiaceae bacterium]MCH4276828.1 hypothetical protein [Atopobiaceae bacterium]MCI1226173.1 hypothetical protein [Atopobiaceae bacterium]MDD3177417.1 hypothetical protein [Atopobiaceae bacterium]